MGVTFRLTQNPAWPGEVDRAAASYLRKVAIEIENDAKRFVPIATGQLRAGIYREVNGLDARIGVRNVGHWSAVEYGTGPHIIRPVNKRALHWPGAAHPVAVVNHPGTPAQPFLRPALMRRRGAL